MDTGIDESTRHRPVLLARSGYVVSGLLHVAIGVIAAGIALGSGGQASSSGALGTVASNPLGQALLWVAAAALVALGAWQLFQAWEDARDGTAGGLASAKGDPKDTARDGASALENSAKGVALGVVGVLFVIAAAQADPDDAGGMDDALKVLGEQPFGQVLLVAVGAGFVAYGIFQVVRARYASE